MTTPLTKQSVIFVKDLSTDTTRAIKVFKLATLWKMTDDAVIAHVKEKSTVAIKDRFFVGEDAVEVRNRLPVFHLKSCKYKIRKIGQVRSRLFKSQTDAIKYSNCTIVAFSHALARILQRGGHASYVADCGDTISLVPPFKVKGLFLVERDCVTQTCFIADDLYHESQDLAYRASRGEDSLLWWTVDVYIPEESKVMCHTPWVTIAPYPQMVGTFFRFQIPAVDAAASIAYLTKRVQIVHGKMRFFNVMLCDPTSVVGNVTSQWLPTIIRAI